VAREAQVPAGPGRNPIPSADRRSRARRLTRCAPPPAGGGAPGSCTRRRCPP
jgi:hypothetical protein